MAHIRNLGGQIIHGGQDIARTESLQRTGVVRLVALSLRISAVTHLSPLLYSVDRRRGANPESGRVVF
jgi:hypothetical protein